MNFSFFGLGRSAVLCAGLTLFAGIHAAHADSVYSSAGFEPPTFLPTLALEGQNGWQKDAGTSTATISTNSPVASLQSLQVLKAARTTGDTRWSIGTPFLPTATLNTLTVDVDMRVNLSAFDFGPAFGLETRDGSKLAGAFSVDAATGEVLYVQSGSGKLLSTGKVISRGAYHHFQLTTDFGNKRYSIATDGALVHTEPFVNGTVTALSTASVATYSVNPATAASESGVAYLDNFNVTSSKVAVIAPTVTAPAAPSNLRVQGGNGQIALSWSASSGATSYNLYRGTSARTETLYRTNLGGTSALDTSVQDGATYYYVLTAVNSGGESAASNEASAVTVPAAPSNLAAAGGHGQIVLSWNESTGTKSYNLYRGDSAGTETLYQSQLNSPNYTDSGLGDGTTYFYKVSSVNASGESLLSNEASATTAAPDLSIDGLSSAPNTPGVGDSVVLTATVTNNSASTTADDQTVTFNDGDTPIGSTSIASLDPGASATVQVTWTPQSAGTHVLSAQIVALAGETNSANNTTSLELTVYNYYTYTTKGSLVANGTAAESARNKWYKYPVGVAMKIIKEVRVIGLVSTYDNSGSSDLGQPSPFLESYVGDGKVDLALVGSVTPTAPGNWVMSSQNAAVTGTIVPLKDNYVDLYIRGLNSTSFAEDQVKVSGVTVQIKYLAP